jgi:hypothetical protein
MEYPYRIIVNDMLQQFYFTTRRRKRTGTVAVFRYSCPWFFRGESNLPGKPEMFIDSPAWPGYHYLVNQPN